MEILKFFIFLNFVSFSTIFTNLKGDPGAGGLWLKENSLSPAH
jgi:hypothetical protein